MFEKIKPGVLYYRWQGVLFLSGDRLPRLDKLYLYTLCTEGDQNRPVIRRILGYRDFNQDNHEIIIFTTSIVHRVLDSDRGRKGWILPKHRLYPNEKTAYAGLARTLTESEEHYGINLQDSRDQYVVNMLDEFFDDGPRQETSEFQAPSMYLSTTHLDHFRQNFQLRYTPALLPTLSRLAVYDPKKSLIENMAASFDVLARDLGTTKTGRSRWGLPFEHLYGQKPFYGVPVADLAGIGQRWLEMELPADGMLTGEHAGVQLALNFKEG